MSIVAKVLIFFIKLYQNTLSPDHGPLRYLLRQRTCRFHPTCSEYMQQAIEKYGVIEGVSRGLKRLRSCHPWNPGGYDPV